MTDVELRVTLAHIDQMLADIEPSCSRDRELLVMTTLRPSPKSRIGLRVRILTGGCVGAIGVITDVDAKRVPIWYRIRLDPPVVVAAAGLINAVWRPTEGIEGL